MKSAILDHSLSDGDTSEICERLKERNVPFVMYSGFSPQKGVCGEGVHVSKPASASVLVATVKGLLAGQRIVSVPQPTMSGGPQGA